MLIETLRRAIAEAPRTRLPEISALLWKAFSAGEVTEPEADVLSTLIEARRAVRSTTAPRYTKPRTTAPERIGRRRRWAASGWLPPTLAERFTQAEVAVLAVVASEHAAKGRCTLAISHIAARAGVRRTTVKKAVREARSLGFLTVRERRHAGRRSETNVVAVSDAGWAGWLRRVRSPVPRGVGCATTLSTEKDRFGDVASAEGRKGLPGHATGGTGGVGTGHRGDAGTPGGIRCGHYRV